MNDELKLYVFRFVGVEDADFTAVVASNQSEALNIMCDENDWEAEVRYGGDYDLFELDGEEHGFCRVEEHEIRPGLSINLDALHHPAVS